MKKLIFLSALISLPALAQNLDILLLAKNTDGKEIFRLLPGGCLRRPLYFSNEKGIKIFELTDGVEYPTNCGQKK